MATDEHGSTQISKQKATIAALLLIGWSLFFRMAIQLNKALPLAKRIPLIEFGYRNAEIKRLYGDSFPESKLSMAHSSLTVAGIFLVAAVIVEVVRTSK